MVVALLVGALEPGVDVVNVDDVVGVAEEAEEAEEVDEEAEEVEGAAEACHPWQGPETTTEVARPE